MADVLEVGQQIEEDQAMITVRLLKADVRPCRACQERGCQRCKGKGYFIYDDSYDITLPDPPPPIHTRAHSTALYWQRRADGQCTYCGSPDLASNTLCAQCLSESNERSRESNRRTREAPGEIG